MSNKYVFVTGGVMSSLGKGIIAASLGRLLRSRNHKITIIKLDPYLNIDPGTMSPYQHGEVFVTDDGAETDLDLGHYERFIDCNLGKLNNLTAGKIYQSVIEKERRGDYLGATVQMIPHLTNEIKSFIHMAAKEADCDIAIVEIGGTVGDIESLIFLEAIRQMRKDIGRDNVCYIHATIIPNLKATNELKTKPTQHSIDTLRSRGIQPDILVCRSEINISTSIREKLSLFTDVDTECVIQCLDVKNLYEVPLMLESEGLAARVLERLNLPNSKPQLSDWQIMVDKIKHKKNNIKIAIVGKYVMLSDAYISVVESLKHAASAQDVQIEIKWVLSEDLETNSPDKYLSDVDGILIPGGFGDRGIEGKILAAKYARVNNIPYLGLCLGMQIAVVEFARNVAKLNDAHSTEFNPETLNPVIDLMIHQQIIKNKGGTMRLGAYPCAIKDNTKVKQLYQNSLISERHRHRYEVNNKYRALLEQKGIIFSGLSPDDELVEIIELKDHPFFVGCQFHPELKSRPNNPHPLFIGFVKAALEKQQSQSDKKSKIINA